MRAGFGRGRVLHLIRYRSAGRTQRIGETSVMIVIICAQLEVVATAHEYLVEARCTNIL